MKFQNRKSLMKTSRTIIGDKRKEETKKEEETKEKQKNGGGGRGGGCKRHETQEKESPKHWLRMKRQEKSEEEVYGKARLENKIIRRKERVMDQEQFQQQWKSERRSRRRSNQNNFVEVKDEVSLVCDS